MLGCLFAGIVGGLTVVLVFRMLAARKMATHIEVPVGKPEPKTKR